MYNNFLLTLLYKSYPSGYKEETRIKDFWDDGDDKVIFRKKFSDRDYFCEKFWHLTSKKKTLKWWKIKVTLTEQYTVVNDYNLWKGFTEKTLGIFTGYKSDLSGI